MTLASSDFDLEKLARTLGVKPILSLEDFDPRFVMTKNEALLAFIETNPSTLVVSERGEIFTATTDHNIYSPVEQYLLKQQMHVSIIPTAASVVEQVYRQAFELNTEQVDETERQADRSVSQKLLDNLVATAEEREASDVHIMIYEQRATVHMRVDGLLRVYRNNASPDGRWSASEAKAICATAVNSEAADAHGASGHFNMEEPKDASFFINTKKGRRKIRYAHTPNGYRGCKAVMRLLAAEGAEQNVTATLESLGYLPEQAGLIEQTLQTPQGLVLVTGPTGSGKSTTLAVCMSMVPPEKAIYTYEDPIETVLPNACQVPVMVGNEKRDWGPLSKNTLRLDPDIIMYGELRDQIVATEAVRQATTGHLVVSTLHTNSGISCVTRLADLGISVSRQADPSLLRLLVCQRLLPTVCAACSSPLEDFVGGNAAQLARLRQYFAGEPVRVANRGTGEHRCKKCDGTGLDGRVLVAEVIYIDEVARTYIERNDLAGWSRHLKDMGWYSIKEHAEVHVRAGRLCPIVAELELPEPFGDSSQLAQFNYKAYRAFTTSVKSKPLSEVAH